MLPPPTLSFTIPSTHDNLVLQCRVYHPTCLAPTKVSHIIEWMKRAAIVAHPYAPLGGSQDDPVIDLVASTILKEGFVVGTFNFRGAGDSKGRTSWQSKAEQDDYISFIGFMIHYLHHLTPPSPHQSIEQLGFTHSPELPELTPIPSQVVAPPHDTLSSTFSSPAELTASTNSNAQPLLLLAGYSYGALITSCLPPMISSVVQPFQSPTLGSAHAEIRMRAESLADQQNVLIHERVVALQAQIHRRGRSKQIEDHILSSPKLRNGGVRMGGEENLRRASHESHRSRSSFTIETPERVKKGVERVRSIAKAHRKFSARENSTGSVSLSSRKKGSESESSLDHVATSEADFEGRQTCKAIAGLGDGLQTAYLLVSPLHGWVSTLATMWGLKSGRDKEMVPDKKFTVDPTLAVFGDDDVFVSVKRLRSWADKLKATTREGEICQFRHREVPGAGHFWHDHEAVQTLQEEVKSFVASL